MEKEKKEIDEEQKNIPGNIENNNPSSGNDADDDNIATPEDMEAFIRDRRERERNNKKDVVDVFGEYAAPENSIDPYLEPDPTLPWVKYEESTFLSRGCMRCPEAYKPVSEIETRSCSKVTSCNWLRGIHQPDCSPFDCVEVRFKNNRKDFYRLPDGLEVTEGDVVAVEGVPGHDIGIVSLTGEVCRIQMEKRHVNPDSDSIHRLFRRAKTPDIERWAEALKEEHNTLMKTRSIAADLNLEMKVNDVEYQGDKSKAIFYYTADERVDFRNLIKLLAEKFHVRVEMKQIGVRQEAGKVGGLGTCGRELCCSTWLTNFKSVTTNAAKVQQILPNPQKLAGQCGKLKCCLNFEYDTYVDALKQFPPANTPIHFKKGIALHKKTDVFRGIMWYAYEGDNELYALKAESVKEIIEKNHRQDYPERLEDYQVELMSTSALAQENSNDEFERELRQMADDFAEGNKSSNDTLGRKQRNDDEHEKHNNRERVDERSGGRRKQNDQRGNHGNRRPQGDNATPHGNNDNRQQRHHNDRRRDRNNDKRN